MNIRSHELVNFFRAKYNAIKSIYMYFVRFLFTILDIGLRRNFLRLIYEFDRLFFRSFGYIYSYLFDLFNINPSLWDENKMSFLSLEKDFGSIPISSIPNAIKFKFLNISRNLFLPIIWNDSSYTRLWQFNLHYFDWARAWIDDSISFNGWIKEFSFIPILIDQWIDNNPVGIGDGWHSYTLSLRIRNWIWCFRCAPSLVNDKRIHSLWTQICWLNTHLEECYGGNHYLENLITLALASSQFKCKKSLAIHFRALKLLKKELEMQILSDGSHEERSASYHVLLLDRLIDLAIVIESSNKYRPDWLSDYIFLMFGFSNLIVLYGNKLPRFNDSASSICSSVSDVNRYANAYLASKKLPLKNMRSNLSRFYNEGFNSLKTKAYNVNQFKTSKELLDFPETGWTIIRPGNNWELIFKSGKGCPEHLPPHVHSDLLSFDLFQKGKPFFIEAGTSTYDDLNIRMYERSSPAHNVIQLGKKQKFNNDISWVEPIDVWSKFRAGRKARVIHRNCGQIGKNTFWVESSHDGFRQIGVSYLRKISLTLNTDGSLTFNLIDTMTASTKVYYRSFWHLGDSVSDNILNSLIKKAESKYNLISKWENTSFANDYNLRIQRKSLVLNGLLLRGSYNFSFDFNIFPH